MNLLIGYGNPLRCDDRIGQYLAETLGECWAQTIALHDTQLTPEMAEPISRAERVVFIDASIGASPGTVACEAVSAASDASDAVNVARLTHHVTPAWLLRAAHTLYGSVPAGLLVSVVGESFQLSTAFSPTIEALIPTITEQVREIIGSFLRNEAEP